MCDPATLTALTASQMLTNIGTVVSVGGGLMQGIQGYAAGQAQARAIGQQRQTEAQLTATQDMRRRAEFQTAIAQQRAELAARGVALDSVTAVALGKAAAREMSFDSQAIRAQGDAQQLELSAGQRIAQTNGVQSLLAGTISAAGDLLTGAPDLWPGFFK